MEWAEILKLREILDYDPGTGVFTRKSRVAPNAATGDHPGCDNGDGYIRFRVNKKKHYAHRLAWLYMTGAWPSKEIDHINGLKSDNRWSNLREVDRATNMQNQHRAQRDNKSTGLLGSYRSGKRYMSTIQANGKTIYLGMHDTAKEAHSAYLKAKQELHGLGA